MQSQSECTYSEGFLFDDEKLYSEKSLHAGICNGSFECGAIVHCVRACMRAQCARTLNQTHRPTHMRNCTWTCIPTDRHTGTYHREIVACSFRVAVFKQIQFASAYTLITRFFAAFLRHQNAQVDSVQTCFFLQIDLYWLQCEPHINRMQWILHDYSFWNGFSMRFRVHLNH